jgi:hypothetical protein
LSPRATQNIAPILLRNSDAAVGFEHDAHSGRKVAITSVRWHIQHPGFNCDEQAIWLMSYLIEKELLVCVEVCYYGISTGFGRVFATRHQNCSDKAVQAV